MKFIPIFYVSANGDSSKDLISVLLELGSFYAVKPENPKINHIDILGGYIQDINIYKKALILNIEGSNSKRSHGWNRSRIIKTLKYLSEVSTLSPLSASIYLTVGKRIREAWRPQYIKLIHENLKKSIFTCNIDLFDHYVKKLEKIGLCVKNLDNRTSALSIVAWSTGAHRHGMALRQIAAQELAGKIFLQGENSSDALVFLTALIVDTYAWLPYIIKEREVVLTTELQYAVAATPLRELVDLMKCLNLPQVIQELRNKIYNSLKEKLKNIPPSRSIVNFSNYLNHLMQIILQDIREYYNKNIRTEALIGRLYILSKEIANKIKREKPKRILITLTEQTAPILIEIIHHEVKNIEKLTIIYTPQTLYNRLLFDEKLKNIINNIQYIPVPSTEPLLTKEILKENIKEQYDLAIVQGSLTVALSVLNSLYGCIDPSKVIFI